MHNSKEFIAQRGNCKLLHGVSSPSWGKCKQQVIFRGSVHLIAFPYLHSRSFVFVLSEICVIQYHVCL